MIVHPSREPHGQAITVEGMRVVTPEKWTELTAAVRGWAESLTLGQQRWQDPQAVAERLTFHKLTAGTFFTAFALPPAAAAAAATG
ncbi:hypothetical protein AB0N09_05505 [Streptomyces erythrochromogenes]|uniref:hypothetical protein n=1 Tax=Streptomyces erythrochromogenes TaxID=285574 RepID=UPI00343A354B